MTTPPNEQPDELLNLDNLVHMYGCQRLTEAHNTGISNDSEKLVEFIEEVEAEMKAAIERYTTSQQVRMLDKLLVKKAEYIPVGNGIPEVVEAIPVSAIEQLRKGLHDD